MKEELPAISELIAISETGLLDSGSVDFMGSRMEELILRASNLPKWETLESDLKENTISRLQELYERYETNLENGFAQKLIKGDVVLEDYPLYQRFKRLIQAEAEIGCVGKKDKMLFVGSGTMPITAILFSDIVSQVDCWDSSEEACSVSERVISCLRLDDKIKIINSTGEGKRIHGYDIILVALLANPKSDILYNTQFSIPEGTRVICRTSEGVRQLFYKSTSDQITRLLGRYAPLGKHEAGQDDTISSLAFKIVGARENR